MSEKRTYERAVVKKVFTKEVVKKDKDGKPTGEKLKVVDTRFMADLSAVIPLFCKAKNIKETDFYQLTGQESLAKMLKTFGIDIPVTQRANSKEKVISNVIANAGTMTKEEAQKIIDALLQAQKKQ